MSGATESLKRSGGIGLFAAFALALFLAVATIAEAAEPVTVKLWDWHVADKKYTQKMAKVFNERHPDIKFEYSSISNTVYDQTLEAAFLAKQPPDIFLPSGKLGYSYLTSKNWLISLNDCAPNDKELQDWMALFPADTWVDGVNVLSGKVYSFYYIGGRIGGWYQFFYNKTLFSDAGVVKPPATYSELRRTAAKITQAGQGKYFGMVRGLRFSEVWGMDLIASLAQAGGFPAGFASDVWLPNAGRGFDRRTGHYVFSSPAFTDAFKVWLGMRDDKSIHPGETSMEDEQAKMAFATNQAAMQFGGDWSPGNYVAYNPDVNFDVALAPTPDDGVRRGYYTSWGTGSGIGGEISGYLISSFAKNPKAVWEVIKFLTSIEYQEGYVKGGYGFSFLPEANRPENLGLPVMAKFLEWGITQWRNGPVAPLEAHKVQNYLPGVYPTVKDVLDNIYFSKAGFDALKDLDKRLDGALDAGIQKAQEAGVKVTRQDFIFPDWDPAKDYYVARKK